MQDSGSFGRDGLLEIRGGWYWVLCYWYSAEEGMLRKVDRVVGLVVDVDCVVCCCAQAGYWLLEMRW